MTSNSISAPYVRADHRPVQDRRPLRIVQLITGSAMIGGAETHVRHLVDGLTFLGHECVVIVGPPNPAFYLQLVDMGVSVRIVRSLQKALMPWRDCMALYEIVVALYRLKPDVVAAHTAKASFIGRLAAAVLGIPCVCTPHGCSVVDRTTGCTSPLFVALERLAGRFTCRLITVSNKERQIAECARIVGREKLATIYNGIPDTHHVADPSREPAVITMVARFEPPKDHHTLLRSLAGLKELPWTLRLVGTGSFVHASKMLAAELNITHRVEFLGECVDVPRLLSESQIFVLSSRLEAFPISILEAMRAGLPVVAANVGGVSEAVHDGETGLLFPAGAPATLAERLRRLLSNPYLRKLLGSNARRRFLDQFTADKMASATLDVYSDALRSRRDDRRWIGRRHSSNAHPEDSVLGSWGT